MKNRGAYGTLKLCLERCRNWLGILTFTINIVVMIGGFYIMYMKR